MGQLVPFKAKPTREDTTSWVGMIIFLASWVMMFGALFFAYGYVRSHAKAWPPAGLPPLPLRPGAANTAVIVLSSVVLQMGIRGFRRARRRWLSGALWTTWALGLLFVVGQLLLWQLLHRQGLPLRGTGTYGSVFYGLTGLHAVHVGVGLLGLGWMAVRASRGAFTPAAFVPVQLWAAYWHFVGGVWLLLFLTVFCL